MLVFLLPLVWSERKVMFQLYGFYCNGRLGSPVSLRGLMGELRLVYAQMVWYMIRST